MSKIILTTAPVTLPVYVLDQAGVRTPADLTKVAVLDDMSTVIASAAVTDAGLVLTPLAVGLKSFTVSLGDLSTTVDVSVETPTPTSLQVGE